MPTALRNILESLQASWDNLNAREKQLVSLLGAVFAAIALLLPLYLGWSELTELQDANDDMTEILREFEKNSATLSKRAAEKKAARRRYDNRAPALGGYVEDKARQFGLKLGDITEQPDRDMGAFTRRSTRVKLPEASLRPLIRWMAEIENSPHAIAIDYIRIEHYQTGDKYSAEIGISAFDRAKPSNKPLEPSSSKEGTP
jgi:type II secretory pathway component PulM